MLSVVAQKNWPSLPLNSNSFGSLMNNGLWSFCRSAQTPIDAVIFIDAGLLLSGPCTFKIGCGLIQKNCFR